MINYCKDVVGKDVGFYFNGKFDGQFRKDGSNEQLLNLVPMAAKFTPFKVGLKRTYEWYEKKSNSYWN